MLENKTMDRKQQVRYEVAGHQINIIDYIGVEEKLALPNFIPFETDNESLDPLIEVVLSSDFPEIIEEDWRLLSDVSGIWDDRYRFQEGRNYYLTSIISSKDSNTWKMLSTKNFKQSIIYLDVDELYITNKLSWLIMVAFGQACLSQKSMLIHSSVVLYKGQGFAFLGKSGTGKSTHSRLWMEHLTEVELLNDDSPAIRILESGEVFIYGTPWSGKANCFKNKKAPLAGISRLSQASYNKYKRKEGLEALVTLLPSGSGIRWDNDIFSRMIGVMELLVKHVPIAVLECKPDRDAVLENKKGIEG